MIVCIYCIFFWDHLWFFPMRRGTFFDSRIAGLLCVQRLRRWHRIWLGLPDVRTSECRLRQEEQDLVHGVVLPTSGHSCGGTLQHCPVFWSTFDSFFWHQPFLAINAGKCEHCSIAWNCVLGPFGVLWGVSIPSWSTLTWPSCTQLVWLKTLFHRRRPIEHLIYMWCNQYYITNA